MAQTTIQQVIVFNQIGRVRTEPVEISKHGGFVKARIQGRPSAVFGATAAEAIERLKSRWLLASRRCPKKP